MEIKPWIDEEDQCVKAYDVLVEGNPEQIAGFIEMRDNQVKFTTNDHYFSVLTADDLREITDFMETKAVFSAIVED